MWLQRIVHAKLKPCINDASRFVTQSRRYIRNVKIKYKMLPTTVCEISNRSVPLVISNLLGKPEITFYLPCRATYDFKLLTRIMQIIRGICHSPYVGKLIYVQATYKFNLCTGTFGNIKVFLFRSLQL